MKYITILILFIPLLIIGQKNKKNQFTINGEIKNLNNCYIYFARYDNGDKRIIDSVLIIDNKFKFISNLNGYLDRFFIKLNPNSLENNDSLNNVKVPIENSIMQIYLEKGKFSRYNLNGCKSCSILKMFDSINQARYKLSLSHDSIINLPTTISSLKEKLNYTDSIEKEKYYKKWLSFCQLNLNKNEATYILYKILFTDNLEQVKAMANKLDYTQKNSYYGYKLKSSLKEIEKDIFEEKNSEIKLLKTKAPFFKSIGFDGNDIDLGETIKKGCIILDFWASWCLPCRKSHPKFIEIFNKYRKSNLNVISISEDENIDEWKKAIVKDSISIWPNMLSLKDENDTNLSQKYNINFYPTKVLIDKNGMIIGIYIGENFSKLEKKLKEIYKY